MYEKNRKSCWSCGNSKVIKWGYQNGKSRFRCKDCGIYFSWSNTSVKQANSFSWFKKWVIEKQTFATLSRDSKHSKRALQNLFSIYLKQAPVYRISKREKVHLLIDGTYISGNICLIIYRDNDIKYTQLYRITTDEIYEEIREDLVNLKSMGANLSSITCDGHPAILKAIKKVFPKITVQRCLFHIQHHAEIRLSQHPKSIAGIELLNLVKRISWIKTEADRQYWLRWLVDWDKYHQPFIGEYTIDEKKKKRYIHKDLRSARRSIIRALPNMFHFIQQPAIPKTTNGLESFFGHLKNNLSIHRGLTTQHRKNFIKWYLYFRNKQK